MPVDAWSFYLLTVLVFMAAPGPSHLLMLSTSLNHGFRPSLATAAGDLCANTLQITLAGLGLAAVVTGNPDVFRWVKWGGVCYLLWIGLRTLLASWQRSQAVRPATAASAQQLWLRGFVSSAANPKAIVFFAALFPQFIDPALDTFLQVALLGATYIVLDGLFLTGYGLLASRLGSRLDTANRRWLDRAAGMLLIVVAALLGLRSL